MPVGFSARGRGHQDRNSHPARRAVRLGKGAWALVLIRRRLAALPATTRESGSGAGANRPRL